MTALLWLVAGLACAQIKPSLESGRANADHDARRVAENVVPPRTAESKIVAVTVYQGQALVTREVTVPEGDGTVELVVNSLPSQAVDNSLYAEGTDGLRVLSTRFRTRVVKEDTRDEVRAKEEALKKLQADAQRMQKEVAVQELDLQYLQKLEGFTGVALNGLVEKGRLESEEILSLSKFVMASRSEKTKVETDLRQQLQANAEAVEFTRRQLSELSNGSSRLEREAVIVVRKARPEVGTVRLGYLIGSASWWPQYRLRGGADNAPVRLEYLAAVAQLTGENWSGIRITLSTARPSLDAAPPEILPLKIADSDGMDSGPVEPKQDRSQKIAAELGKPIDMHFPNETPLEVVLKYIRNSTTSPTFPEGIPVYLDPVGLRLARKTSTSLVTMDLKQVPLRTSLKLLLEQLGLSYQIRDGLLKITSASSVDDSPDMGAVDRGVLGGTEVDRTSGAARLNQLAAGEQAEELSVEDGQGVDPNAAAKDAPGVTFPIAGSLDISSRRDPQLLEIARVDLPAEYYAKAVPILTPRVYRLAKLTNKSDFVLLPGEATVYVGSDFVGRMRLPLVAAGEPFIAGFGADPQLQVSRRLIRKSRSVQGGNQVFTYEFRIGLRNYRPGPVKVQVWDRLPKAQDEAVAVSLVKTSAELSTDSLYQRAARMDNLLRWDVDVPAGTVGDKTMYQTYEFRLEYSRDLPQPQFVSGGLGEAPIGGGAMGGMGGMGGGLR